MSRPAAYLLALIALTVPAAAAQKTDVVIMANGDHVTCEIKQLDRGLLEVKTDSWGTISIEWGEIARITTPSRFEIHLESGERLTGALEQAPDAGEVTVVGGAVDRVLPLSRIVFMEPVSDSFWRQFDGAVDVGYSYASAGNSTQWTMSADILRRREGMDTRLSIDSFFSSKEGADDTSRHSAYADVVRYLLRRWGLVAMAQAQRNDELQLKLRTQVGGGGLHHFIRSNRAVVSAFAGAVFNNEQFTDETPSSRSWELLFGAQFEYFVFNTPKTQLTAYVRAFPSLTTSDRIRLETEASARRELVKDLFVNLSLNHSYDRRPPSADAQRSDLTLVTSLGWSF